MKKSIAKLVSLLLVLVMAIGVLPLTASADTVAPAAVHVHSYQVVSFYYDYHATNSNTHSRETVNVYQCSCGLMYESVGNTTYGLSHSFGAETCYDNVHSGSTHTYYYKKTCTLCYYVSYRQNTIACDGSHMVEG